MKTTPAKAPAATLVVFGAKGDLTRRLLIPAMANLVSVGLVDDATRILGVDHNELTREEFITIILKSVKDRSARHWIEKRAQFLQGEFDEASTYEALAKALKGPAVFYLATSPRFFGPVVEKLAEAGLFDEADGFRRVVIEKPFGSDLASAKALNALILARAREDQVFRIDHFLGKETVQNLMIFRFANPLFEAVWNSRYIDHVQITAAETVDVGTRATFYDATGALRDMAPNHLFQLLAMVGMEPPNSFDADAIRTEKSKVIAAIRPIASADAVRGVYEGGKVVGQDVVGYLKADGVDPKSRTETYVAMKVMVDTCRWSETPFYLRTGKALTARDTEIVIAFREAPIAMFKHLDGDPPTQNRLVIRIQPNEGIGLTFSLKPPGPLMAAEAQTFDFRYDKIFKLEGQTGYETLIYDVLIGDQTLFQRADQIEGGWRAVQDVLDAWTRKGKPEPYAAGSAGPDAADDLLARDGRKWRELG